MPLRPCPLASRLTCGCCSAQWAGWWGPGTHNYQVRVAVVATPPGTWHRRQRRCCTLHVARDWSSMCGRAGMAVRCCCGDSHLALPRARSARRSSSSRTRHLSSPRTGIRAGDGPARWNKKRLRRDAKEYLSACATLSHDLHHSQRELLMASSARRCSVIFQAECSGDWLTCGPLTDMVPDPRRSGTEPSCARYLTPFVGPPQYEKPYHQIQVGGHYGR